MTPINEDGGMDIEKDSQSTQQKIMAQIGRENESKGMKYSNQKKGQISAVFGSRNLGNTCFFNSAMQCLNATIRLREFYINN